MGLIYLYLYLFIWEQSDGDITLTTRVQLLSGVKRPSPVYRRGVHMDQTFDSNLSLCDRYRNEVSGLEAENMAANCQRGLQSGNTSIFMWSSGGIIIARGKQKTLEEKRVA
jgi:hypothetical protein